MSTLEQVASMRYEDPLTRIDWSAVDRDCWWLPPQALSLAEVAQFEALPLKQRQHLSQLEYVHLLQAGLWLESQFMARMARLAHRATDVERRTRLLNEVREEAGHSLMFVELLERSGFGVEVDRSPGVRLIDALGRLLPSDSALFWAMVVVAEELPDRLNRRLRRGVEEATLSAVVYRIAEIHLREEAQHAAYSRTQCRAASARTSALTRAVLAPFLSLAIDLYARYVCFPSAALYERAGLSPGRSWRDLALANPARRRQVREMLAPSLAFLRRHGWRVRGRLTPDDGRSS